MLLIGPPGIGKAQIMEQIARECRIGLVAYTITHHTRQSAVEYAQNRQIHRAIISYLELRTKNFYRIEADVGGMQFVTARG